MSNSFEKIIKLTNICGCTNSFVVNCTFEDKNILHAANVAINVKQGASSLILISEAHNPTDSMQTIRLIQHLFDTVFIHD